MLENIGFIKGVMFEEVEAMSNYSRCEDNHNNKGRIYLDGKYSRGNSIMDRMMEGVEYRERVTKKVFQRTQVEDELPLIEVETMVIRCSRTCISYAALCIKSRDELGFQIT